MPVLEQDDQGMVGDGVAGVGGGVTGRTTGKIGDAGAASPKVHRNPMVGWEMKAED